MEFLLFGILALILFVVIVAVIVVSAVSSAASAASVTGVSIASLISSDIDVFPSHVTFASADRLRQNAQPVKSRLLTKHTANGQCIIFKREFAVLFSQFL